MKGIYLREATLEDIDLIFRWANDPIVRKNSFNSNPILYDNHVAWYHRMMEDDSVLQFVLMEDDEPVGQIRLTVEKDEAEIGYSIALNHRGKGYGHRILQLTEEEMKKHHPEIKRLIAKVKPENEASNRLFQSEDYEMEYVKYSKPLT